MTDTVYDVAISFDTTGSMHSCIQEVRKNISDLTSRLFKEIPGIRIALMAHGDYCDEKISYLFKSIDFTNNGKNLIEFINNTVNTGGGDAPEAYEYMLRESQKLSWSSNTLRALVVIGDAPPHEQNQNPYKINWRNEVDEIKKMGINIYSVQALYSGNGEAYTFYKQMAQATNGYHLFLDQFSYIRDILLAICYKQLGTEHLEKYEQEIKAKEYGMTLSIRKIFDTMLGRKVDTTDNIVDYNEDDDKLTACPPAKYQIMDIENNMSIKEFVISKGLKFKSGKGFYEFTKPETIQSDKLVVLQKKITGELFEGKKARKIIGLGGTTKKYKPTDFDEYRVFIQSTSCNRKLIAGTRFLYEAEDYGKI